MRVIRRDHLIRLCETVETLGILPPNDSQPRNNKKKWTEKINRNAEIKQRAPRHYESGIYLGLIFLPIFWLAFLKLLNHIIFL